MESGLKSILIGFYPVILSKTPVFSDAKWIGDPKAIADKLPMLQIFSI
jgi:hypothetical protein